MRTIFTLFFAVLFCSVFGQNTQVATLERGTNTIGVYYGEDAFISAHTAGIDGDVITLSKGTFTGPSDFEKRMSVYGVGYLLPDGRTNGQTIVTKDISLGQGAGGSHFEGIKFTDDFACRNATEGISALRCYFNNYSASECEKMSLIECVIYYFSLSSSNDCLLSKSILYHLLTVSRGSGNQVANNIFLRTQSYFSSGVMNFHFPTSLFVYNNVIVATSGNSLWEGSSTKGVSFENNLFLTDPYDTDETLEFDSFQNNYTETDLTPSEIFTNYNIDNGLHQHDFHLKQTKWLGKDGTTVGIYGTSVPFKELATPTTPVIIKDLVEPTTDAQGRLKVDISVQAQTK